MKKSKIYSAFTSVLVLAVLFVGCKEEEFSAYDIEFPMPKIESFSPENSFIGESITISGSNLKDVTTVRINGIVANINAETQTDDKIEVEVPRSATAGPIVVENKYRREATSEAMFTPKYYDVTDVVWPSKIERKGNFRIQASNADMISKVTVNNVEVTIMPNATESAISVSVAGLDLSEVNEAVIRMTTRSGNTVPASPAIPVEDLSLTYTPAKTIMLFDFETTPNVVPGDATLPYTADLNLNDLKPAFGSYYSVISAKGNGWDGSYMTLKNDNDGNGFDMSNHEKPYISFLVNTNGKQGYVQPVLTINGSRTDKHLTGQDGEYADNYSITTTGWEWRSYDLEKLGFDVSGLIEVVEMGFRGGNVGNNNDQEFEIHVDQIMITDGPLNPTIVTDCEALLPFASQNGGTLTLDGGVGLTGYHEGNHYFTVKKAGVASWEYLGDFAAENIALDATKIQNGVFLNFLVNTGNDNGYFQLEIVQGDNKGGKHFAGENEYGDNYMFTPTAGIWVWRSVQIIPEALENWGGDPANIDLSAPFSVKIGFSAGNVNGNFETNVDYFVFTTAPLDPTLDLKD